jgi:hypothetical protein
VNKREKHGKEKERKERGRRKKELFKLNSRNVCIFVCIKASLATFSFFLFGINM